MTTIERAKLATEQLDHYEVYDLNPHSQELIRKLVSELEAKEKELQEARRDFYIFIGGAYNVDYWTLHRPLNAEEWEGWKDGNEVVIIKVSGQNSFKPIDVEEWEATDAMKEGE